MKCEACQNLLVKLVSGEISDLGAEAEQHITQCSTCTTFLETLLAVIDNQLEKEEINAPNLEKMWSGIIAAIGDEKPKSLWSRFWTLSFGQLIAGILVIALFSSILTGLVIVNFANKDKLEGKKTELSIAEKFLADIGLIEPPQKERIRKIEEQQEAIRYWSKKIEERRHQWNKNLQQVFDRNLEEIDKVVAEYKKNLEENPYDEISVEMLDSAMKEKLELLRQFAEL
ncbi:MAG: hypothetical protein D6735_02070 [Acidobacteria bacterium]|nr:MAG: hypothetical protein D6735_02070 [Acidobacteriota bacterium]